MVLADRPTLAEVTLADLSFADLAAFVGELRDDADGRRLRQAIASYDAAWLEEFSREHDHLRLLGQDNIRRYLPFATVCVRATPADSWFDVVARVAAARVTGARVLASFTAGCPHERHDRLDAWTESWGDGIELVEQADAEIMSLLARPEVRIRYAARDRVSAEVRRAAAAVGQRIANVPVVAAGRIKLLWYLREQSISHDYRRYGNLGCRAGERRGRSGHGTP
jgi:RHH-type proline utilization regulon transcriptional repressor/proline dehydrogenase/delta 1-pyrroline-5-carboxylate dehydrogenase